MLQQKKIGRNINNELCLIFCLDSVFLNDTGIIIIKPHVTSISFQKALCKRNLFTIIAFLNKLFKYSTFTTFTCGKSAIEVKK